MVCYILLCNAHFSQSYQFQMAKIKSPYFSHWTSSYNGKCMTFQKLKGLRIKICVVLFKIIGKKKNLFQTGTSPNDFISDKLGTSRDNEMDSETDRKVMRQENRNKRGQTGTWSLKDKRHKRDFFPFFSPISDSVSSEQSGEPKAFY